MSIVISSDVVLSVADTSSGVTDDNPRIGYHNVLTPANVTASTSDASYGVSNVANPATHLKWKATGTGVQTIQVALASAETVNYFALCGHNLGTTGANIKLQSSTDGASWTDVTTAVVLPNNYAYMYEFADVSASYYRLHITAVSEIPELAVLYIGRVLRMQRRIYVGHKPVTLNRKVTVGSGTSESGQYLGRVVTRRMLDGAAEFRNITPGWYRSYFDPFVLATEDRPFFFAWRPGTYPDEVGYMWMDDVDAANQSANGLMSISIRMQGMR